MKIIQYIGVCFVVLFLGVIFTGNIMAEDSTNIPDAIVPNYPDEVFGTDVGVVDLRRTDLTAGYIFSKILPYIYTVAGLVLLFMLIAGGLGLMTAAGDPKKVEGSQKRITMALVGFLIVFVSYLVVQLVGVMLGADLLGGDSGASQVEVTKFNSDGEVVSREVREIESGKLIDQEIESEPEPDVEPCENYSLDDCPSSCSTYDGACVEN